MSQVPVTIVGMIYPRDKSVAPYPATIQGYAHITGLEVGGGPIIDGDPGVPIEPPLTIWPNPPEGTAPMPEHPIVLPDPITPPDQPPATPEKPHEGWNWSAAKSGWYFLYIPREGDAQPKRR